MAEDKSTKNLNLEISEEQAMGKYANLAVVNHSQTEFVLDFVNIMPGMPKAKVHSRVVMSPTHLKRLHAAIGENIAKYEQQHGPINVPMSYVPFNLGPQGEA